MKKIIFLFVIFLTQFSFNALTSENNRIIYVEKMPNVQKFIKKMNQKYDFSITELTNIFSKVTLRKIVIKKTTSPAEAMTWKKYRKIFLTKKRIKKGVQFIKENLKTLQRAYGDFGVPMEIVTAILGIETNYGKNIGKYLAINALSSLAFQPNRRQKFFTSQLVSLLLLSREENINIARIKSSYAGAIGIAQFIPSSYRSLAIDYNGDHSRDLIYSKVDAIGSVAHYFAKHNWKKDGLIAEFIPYAVPKKNISSKAYKLKSTLKFWQKKGIKANNPNKKNLARIVGFKGKNGDENWMIYANFYAITRYNHSKLYAMAVFQLSDKIKKAYQKSLLE